MRPCAKRTQPPCEQLFKKTKTRLPNGLYRKGYTRPKKNPRWNPLPYLEVSPGRKKFYCITYVHMMAHKKSQGKNGELTTAEE